MKSKRLYYVIMPFIMAFTLLISLFAPLVPTNLSSAATINASGLSANDAKITENNKEVSGDTYTSKSYDITYNWSIPDNADVQNGDTMTFSIPSKINIDADHNLDIYNKSNKVVGTATITKGSSTGTITITNAENLKRYGREGTLTIQGKGTTTDSYGGNYVINKQNADWLSSDNTLGWQILYNPDAKPMNNVVITDTTTNQKYVEGSVKVYEGTVDKANNNQFSQTSEITGTDKAKVTINNNGGTRTLKIDLGNITTAIYITYQTKPDSDFHGTLNNQAEDQDGNKDSADKYWKGDNGAVTGYAGSASLKKVSSIDPSKTLSGATFKIVKYENDKVGETVKGAENLTTDKNGEISYDDLPDGKFAFIEIKAPDGYELDTTPHAFEISTANNHVAKTLTVSDKLTESKPETTSITVKKEWNDSDNVDNLRPTSIDVQLYKVVDGKDIAVDGKKDTLSAENNWKTTFLNLPKKDSDGNTITYKVKEVDVPAGYTSTASNPVTVDGDSVTITNSHTPAITYLLVNKKWVGGDLLRPSEVQVQLYANGKESGDPVTLNLGNNWSYDFTNLPVNDENGKINYTVKEVTDVPNYTSTQTPGDNAVTITNTYKPGKTQLSVNKVWNDSNNQDKLRPDKITVQLYKTVGKTTTKVDGKTVELTAKNDWAASFTDLDATDSDGNPITYTAKEVAVPTDYGEKYEYSNDGKSETITNTHPAPETTSLTVNKVWNDKKTSHPSVKVQLYKVDGTKKTAVGEPVTLSDKAGWSHTFDKLAKDATYTVEEVEGPSGYISEVSKAVNGKVTITNTPEAKTQYTVNKVWNDSDDKDHKRPTSVEAQLYANGEKYRDAVELTADKDWTYTWTDLPQNDSKGNKINYTVKEVDVPEGYAASYKTEGNVTTITNTYPAPETTSLKVNKAWKNGDPNLRPTSVEVQLYANGEKSGEPVTLNQGNNWSYDFKNLVKNDDNGEPIKYTVEETTKVANYTSTQTTKDNAVTITNTYTPGKTQLTVNKVWNDDSNKANLRPSSVKVQLYANDQKSGEPVTINADKDGNWSYTFDNLDETDSSGKKITYTAKEVGVPEGYGATYEYSKDGKTETITNTHPAPETKKLTVDKIWSDNNSSHSAVKVQLYKVDGKDKTAVGEPVTLSSADGWTHTFTDLDKNSKYTVAEVDVPNGYTSEVGPVTNGKVTITNTLNQTSLTVNKVWKDSNNKAGKRPSSIQVQLYANNEKSGKPVTIKPNAEGDWTYTFSNLDEVDENDKVISYRAEEVNVPEGYASTSKTEGKVTTITNTYPAPETTSFKVTKDWKDNNNEYGLRPSEVTVQLLANGKNYGEPIVLNQGNNWTHEFTGLPKADTIYSVKEITNLANYTSTVDTSHDNEAVITNTVIPPTTPPVHPTSQKTQLTVNKVWNDNNNQDGKRPSEVDVKLLANGKDTGKTVTLSDKNNWVATFGDLDKNDSNGNAISYTVEEVKVDGYTAKVDKVNDEQVTITNTRDTVPPTKPTTPSQPVTPPTKPTTPSQPVVPPVKSTTTTTPTTTTSKTNKPETFTDQVKQVVNGLLPQTGADRRNAIITYVGLIIVIVVIISWGMITVRKRNK